MIPAETTGRAKRAKRRVVLVFMTNSPV
jgi:hypothetical protein